jgi:hypothetical protein
MTEINVPLWLRFETIFNSAVDYENPLQEVQIEVTFTHESGTTRFIDAFWDGERRFVARFMPDLTGQWRFETTCSDPDNAGLTKQTGVFTCVPNTGSTAFNQHGPIRLSDNRRYLAHADGTPFFWMADTCWNGPLHATSEEWSHYLDVRVGQQFNTVQWVATQWLSAPDGDITGTLPVEGHERIRVNPQVFQRLDVMQDAINEAGLLSVPVLLWAAEWGDPAVMAINPGLTLPEDQAILLARYMVARWGANHVAWMLPGDGEYRGMKAERWRRIGRAVFRRKPHAPVMLHPNGLSWYGPEFRHEDWLDIIGYQSCHFGDEDSLGWFVFGPPASDWQAQPVRPIINLEPNYEYHLDIVNPDRRFDDYDVRRAIYWSLLVSPTAGVTYGGHGVWAWDGGTRTPIAHDRTGIPLHWRDALHMPGAKQMRYVSQVFHSFEWWRLEPLPQLIVSPADLPSHQASVAARTDDCRAALVYLPSGTPVQLNARLLPERFTAVWFDPRTGDIHSAQSQHIDSRATFDPPSRQDWLLVIRSE